MPRLQWNGTGNRHIDVPGVGPRGLVVLEPGVNKVTDAELAAMLPHLKLELDNAVMVILPEGPAEIAPGVVEPFAEQEPEADEAPKFESILDELLSKNDAELAEIAAGYGVTESFTNRDELARAIMVKAGYAVDSPSKPTETPEPARTAAEQPNESPADPDPTATPGTPEPPSTAPDTEQPPQAESTPEPSAPSEPPATPDPSAEPPAETPSV